MENIVYQQIRNEMTSIFSSFRQLQIGQYVSVGGLITLIFGSGKNEMLYCLKIGVVLAGLLFAFSYLGKIWHSHATRLGAYLLVTHDIPIFNSINKSSQTSGGDISDCWILANRAESFKMRTKYHNKHPFQTDLKMFFFQQAIFSITSFIVIFSSMIIHIKNPGFPIIRFYIVLALFIIESFYFICEARKKEFFGRNEILNWKDYIDKRIDFDNNFLDHMNLKT